MDAARGTRMGTPPLPGTPPFGQALSRPRAALCGVLVDRGGDPSGAVDVEKGNLCGVTVPGNRGTAWRRRLGVIGTRELTGSRAGAAKLWYICGLWRGAGWSWEHGYWCPEL